MAEWLLYGCIVFVLVGTVSGVQFRDIEKLLKM
jgi:hypothetical protein